MSTLQAVKVSPLIERVSDHKDFKKLLRTRTNVLVLYTKSGECQTYVLEYNAVSMAVFKHIYASSSLVSLTIMTSMAFRGSVCIAFLHFSISAKYTSSSVSHQKCLSRVLYLRRGKGITQNHSILQRNHSHNSLQGTLSFALVGRGMHSAMCDVWFPAP